MSSAPDSLAEPTQGALSDWRCPECNKLLERHAMAPGSVVQIKCDGRVKNGMDGTRPCNLLLYAFETVVGTYVVRVRDVLHSARRGP
jgi:hypothetical protein